MLEQMGSDTDKYYCKREMLKEELFNTLYYDGGINNYDYVETLVNWLFSQYPDIKVLFELVERGKI